MYTQHKHICQKQLSLTYHPPAVGPGLPPGNLFLSCRSTILDRSPKTAEGIITGLIPRSSCQNTVMMDNKHCDVDIGVNL